MLWIILAAFTAGILGFRKGLRQGYNLGRAEAFYSHTVRERLSSRLAEPCTRRSPYIGNPNASPLARPPQTPRGNVQRPHSGVVRPFTPLGTVPEPRPAMGRLALLGVVAALLGIALGFGLRHTVKIAPRPAIEKPEAGQVDTTPEEERPQADIDTIVKTYGGRAR